MLDFILTASVMYFMALLMIRLLGKRALGELGPFDFVVMTGVGHTVVSVALDKSIPFYDGIVILATLAALEYLMGYLALKNQTLSNLITGRPVVLIDDGKIIKENLKKEKFNVDDLLQELRKQGIRNLDEVDKGILESCGGFSVILKEDDEPVTRRDLGMISAERNEIPTFKTLSRGEFFDLLEQGFAHNSPDISLPEAIGRIEQRLDVMEKQLDLLVRDGKKDDWWGGQGL